MKNSVRVKYEDLIIKDYKLSLNRDIDFPDLDRNFNLFKEFDRKKHKNSYSIIICEIKVGNTKVKFISPRLNIDADNLKIKLYLKGYVDIRYEENFTSYYYDLSFLS